MIQQISFPFSETSAPHIWNNTEISETNTSNGWKTFLKVLIIIGFVIMGVLLFIIGKSKKDEQNTEESQKKIEDDDFKNV